MIDLGKHMVAPCGMNCSFCYVHHKNKSPCLGCRVKDGNQPKSCQDCKIKSCISDKNLEFCFQCSDYPCTLIKRLDRSYRTRYDESLIKTLDTIKNEGLDNLIISQYKKYRCTKCGSFINMHDKKCYKCDK